MMVAEGTVEMMVIESCGGNDNFHHGSWHASNAFYDA